MSSGNQYINSHNSTPLEMSTMYVNDAATPHPYTTISDASFGQKDETVKYVNDAATPHLYTTISDASLVQREETVQHVNGAATNNPNNFTSNASLGQTEKTFKRTRYGRVCCLAVIILLTLVLIALVIVGILLSLEPSKHPDQYVCSLESFKIGDLGYINCKKRLHGDVNIILERKGYYFGDWATLLTISGEGSGKALNDRLTFIAIKNADIMEIHIAISEVQCGDRGYLALNYSDGSRTNIEVNTISAVPPSCSGSETRSLHPINNFMLTCSWCPGHDVEQVLVNHTKTIGGVGSMQPSFPISFFLDTRTEHKEQNLTVRFTQQYGVMRIDITRLKGVRCNYGGDYSITLRSPQGSSNRNIHVNIKTPRSMYTYSMTDTLVIAARDLDIEFKGFMGCSVSNIIAKKDGVSLLASTVTVADEDFRDALALKIIWSYEPVVLAMDNTVINASVSFLPMGETTPRSYTVSKRFDVLDGETDCSTLVNHTYNELWNFTLDKTSYLV